MRNKKIAILLIILIIITITIGLNYYFKTKKTYTITIPELDKIISITLIKDTSTKTINNIDDLKSILELINKLESKIKDKSVQDKPIDEENLIKIDFKFKEDGTSTIYVYEKNNKYYIEQPYIGIYEITEKNYKQLTNYIK